MDSLKKGVGFGVMLALLFCCWITFVRLNYGEAAFTKHRITYPGTLASYLLMGAGAGALVGGLMPWATSPSKTFFTGLIGGIPITFGILYQTEGPLWRWDGTDMELAAILSIVWAFAIGGSLQKRLSTQRAAD
jgi:hypothetical protein